MRNDCYDAIPNLRISKRWELTVFKGFPSLVIDRRYTPIPYTFPLKKRMIIGEIHRHSTRHTIRGSRIVQDAFKDSMIHEGCKSHYFSQFAAFFIDARA
jgi:hypothetical protein